MKADCADDVRLVLEAGGPGFELDNGPVTRGCAAIRALRRDRHGHDDDRGGAASRVPRQTVWEKLNDPEVLKATIPGCESLEKTSDTSFPAVAVTKIGPVKAKWKGKVNLTDLDPPNGYKIVGEGEGGVAGFAKGAPT